MIVEKDQHFLINQTVIKKLISELELKKEDKIIEIGAGTGNITSALSKKENPILAFEIDSNFEPFLKNIVKERPNLNIKIDNALNHSWKDYNKIIGNIPFSAAESIIQKSIEDRISLLSILVSDNLKKTIFSDTKLGVISQLFFDVKSVIEVEKEDLSPEPDVDLWILQLKRREPKNKVEKILREIITKNGKIKNAIVYSLMKEGKTKNEAREILEKMRLSNSVLKKPAKRITAQFIIHLESELSKIL